jgi:hypothetical protein
MSARREAKKLARQARREKRGFRKSRTLLWSLLPVLAVAFAVCYAIKLDVEFATLTGILWGATIALIAIPLVLGIVGYVLRFLWKMKFSIIFAALIVVAVPVVLLVALGGEAFDLQGILVPLFKDVLALIGM